MYIFIKTNQIVYVGLYISKHEHTLKWNSTAMKILCIQSIREGTPPASLEASLEICFPQSFLCSWGMEIE